MPYRQLMPKWKLKMAKRMRRNETTAEKRLWQSLRLKRLQGLRFRRQAPILGYIADFFCPSLQLVVEVDGSAHDGREVMDATRDTHPRRYGFNTIRVTNDDVLSNLNGVLKKILTET